LARGSGFGVKSLPAAARLLQTRLQTRGPEAGPTRDFRSEAGRSYLEVARCSVPTYQTYTRVRTRICLQQIGSKVVPKPAVRAVSVARRTRPVLRLRVAPFPPTRQSGHMRQSGPESVFNKMEAKPHPTPRSRGGSFPTQCGPNTIFPPRPILIERCSVPTYTKVSTYATVRTRIWFQQIGSKVAPEPAVLRQVMSNPTRAQSEISVPRRARPIRRLSVAPFPPIRQSEHVRQSGPESGSKKIEAKPPETP